MQPNVSVSLRLVGGRILMRTCSYLVPLQTVGTCASLQGWNGGVSNKPPSTMYVALTWISNSAINAPTSGNTFAAFQSAAMSSSGNPGVSVCLCKPHRSYNELTLFTASRRSSCRSRRIRFSSGRSFLRWSHWFLQPNRDRTSFFLYQLGLLHISST